MPRVLSFRDFFSKRKRVALRHFLLLSAVLARVVGAEEGTGFSATHKRMESAKGRRILCAVDESEESLYAFKWCLDKLNLTSRDTLILCHAKRLPSYYEGLGGPGFVLTPEVLLSVQKYHDRVAENVMRRAMDVCKDTEANVESKIVAGDAREAICSAVKKFEADFLVVGSHGYGAVKRTFLGSVSDYCAHHAKCPVTIVKKPHV